MRAWVYIDGFNLYSGLLRGSPHRWLDLLAFARRLLPNDSVERTKYFTARVDARPNDPGQLADSLFPDEMTDGRGAFRKPAEW